MAKNRKSPLSEAEMHAEAERLMRGDSDSGEDNMDIDEPFEESSSSFHPSSSEEECGSSSDENHNEDMNIDDDEDEQWTDTDIQPILHSFLGQEGLKINIPENSKPLDFFLLVFDNLLIEKVRDWTNARATSLMNQSNLRRHSNMKKWSMLTSEELKKFFGLCIMMGNIQMPSIKLYWSRHFLYEHPLFGKVMSRTRFESILRCLCFYGEADNTSHRLHKIDQVLSHILHNIENIYSPGENLSLDEALVLWRGRLCFRQYIPNKTAKYGIKLYELCTPDGFILNAIVYTGKGTVTNEQGHAASVVNELAINYLGKGHTIYMDNYYNSVDLTKFLYKQKTHVVGTLRKNRKKNPTSVVGKNLKKGETIFQRSGSVLVQKWKDKREVLVISSRHKAVMEKTINKRGIIKMKPSAIADYNRHMSGIDRGDQMLAYYSTPRKSVRWYLKLFFHLFDMSLWNSCWLYNKVHKNKKTYLQFRGEIAEVLLANVGNATILRPSTNSLSQHFPVKLEKRRRCRVCSTKKKRSVTWYACEICKESGELIGLCVENCFKEYHVNK